MSFVYTPRVHQPTGIVTPDVLLDRVYVSMVGETDRYPLPIDRVTTQSSIQVVGKECRPNAAVAIIASGAGALLTAASNCGNVTEPGGGLSCVRPICREAWRANDVAGHLDQIKLQLTDVSTDSEVIIQDGFVGDVVDDRNLEAAKGSVNLYAGLRMTSTPVGPRFRVVLSDPILGRRIDWTYTTEEI